MKVSFRTKRQSNPRDLPPSRTSSHGNRGTRGTSHKQDHFECSHSFRREKSSVVSKHRVPSAGVAVISECHGGGVATPKRL